MLSAGMDALAQIYKVQFDKAARLAQQGDERAALDILYRLRLKPDLGIYRRALVNYLLSINAPLAKDRLIYADECLDLIDILRKQKGITHDQELEDMEEAVLDIRDDLRATMAPAGGSSIPDAVAGPAEPASDATDAETTDQTNPEKQNDTELEATRQDVFTCYPPRQETRPLSKPLPIRPKQAMPEGDAIDNAPLSEADGPPSRQD